MRHFVIPTIALSLLTAGWLPAQERFPVITQENASQLYEIEKRLPAWALTLAKPLPKTTAAMLRLEYVHRAENPLGGVLAGKLHWIAADAIGCEYARRDAEADLRRAGLKNIKMLADPSKMTAKERAAIDFARKMTTAAYTVTDEEFAELVKMYGPDQTVAMVHTLAWANFRNRILLAIGTPLERDGALEPINLQLDKERKDKLETPARPEWKEVKNADVRESILAKVDWRKQSDTEIAGALEKQKGRKGRIALPDLSKLDKLPPDAKARMSRIVWSRVSLGYQPLLTQTWFDTMNTFQSEAQLDRVFSNSMFWVITRSNECLY